MNSFPLFPDFVDAHSSNANYVGRAGEGILKVDNAGEKKGEVGAQSLRAAPNDTTMMANHSLII